jgi:hypothetical protein
VRGSDWYDNGQWLELHRQTWTANSPSSLSLINSAWRNLFGGVARANVVLNALQPNSIPNQATIEAELHALRAYFYYVLQDAFGGVPIVTDVELKPRERNTRDSVFRFIEAELKAARPNLPPTWDDNNYGRFTQGAVDAILASLYLNAEVFDGEVTASGLTKGTARWAEAAEFADSVINSGHYSLATNWRSNFGPDNDQGANKQELILVARNNATDGLGLTFINRAGHYNTYTSPGGWNGFSTIAETYNAFSDADARKQIFLVGPQISLETGQPIKDRAGNPLVFTVDIGNIEAAAENEGARVVKFTFDPAHFEANMGNDFTLFRLAEMYLIKAEALNELGQTPEAIDIINNFVRARVFSPPQPLDRNMSQAAARDAILNERLLELTSEAKRRTDLVRHGKFLLPWTFKDDKTAEPFRILFPIPQSQIQTNPLLAQNPGY